MMASTAAMTAPKIMRRPEAEGASAAGVVATAPHTEQEAAVCKTDTGSVPAVMLEREDKNVDGGGATIVSKPEGPAGGGGDASAAPSNGQTMETEPTVDSPHAASATGGGAPEAAAAPNSALNPLEDVDSALLSALCDQRERKALYKLEQVMLDFMRDKKRACIEVGGAFNSVVLNQESSTMSGGNGSNDQGDATAAILNQQGLRDLEFQQQRGLRQTSFQRLILHRLADRFDILREQNCNLPDGSPGLIRLVKTPESCAPSDLLIDIDLAVLDGYQNPRARNYNAGANSGSFNSGYQDSARNLSESMASATLENQPPAIAGSNKKPKKKMVIMKRNSSSGSGMEGKSKGKSKGKGQRKKLEDREKAYEEARKRIFGVEASEGGSDDNGGTGEGSIPQSQGADPQDTSTAETNGAPPQDAPASDGAGGGPIVPSQLVSSSAHSSTADLSSPPSNADKGEGDQEPPSPNEGESPRQMSFASSNSSVPASKAVYRNRQQEEADPDFKRRSDVRPAYVPYNPMAAPYVPGMAPSPYGQQPMHPQMMAMPMPPQMQQPPPHFYHGQQQQFPTPQDANYAAAMAHAGNQHPQQWAAQAASPPQGYYPTQPGGHLGQHHPQAWQPQHPPQRANSGPMQPQPMQMQQPPQRSHSGQLQQPQRMDSGQMQQPSGQTQQQQTSTPSGKGQSADESSAPPPTSPNDVPRPVSPSSQPAKVLWGPGMGPKARTAGEEQKQPPTELSDEAPTAEGGAPKAEEAAALTAEDFPALGA